MRAQLSNRDYEQLSAYIDGQLTPAEARKLEERLHVHSDLQAALDEMSRTRALLRSAPRRRAPRNFTLTPAMVGARKPARSGSWWNLFPVLSFTSAIATLVLVATILFQLLPGQLVTQTAALQPPEDRVADIVQQTMTAMQAQATAPAALAAPQESGRVMDTQPPVERQAEPGALPTQTPAQPEVLMQSTVESTVEASADAAAPAAAEEPVIEATPLPEQPAAEGTPPVIAWGGSPGPAGLTEGGGMGGGDGQNTNPGALMNPPAVTGAEQQMGKGGGGGVEQPLPGQIIIPQESVNPKDTSAASEPNAEPAQQPAPAQGDQAITGTGPILGVPAQGEGGQIVERKAIRGQADGQQQQENAVPERSNAPDQAPGAQPQTLFGLPAVLVLQVLLALIAIGAGVAAFIVRRRAR